MASLRVGEVARKKQRDQVSVSPQSVRVCPRLLTPVTGGSLRHCKSQNITQLISVFIGQQ